MKRLPLRDWRPTGWSGAFCIRSELRLPGAADLVCYRDSKTKRWRWRLGEYDHRMATMGKSFARLPEAKLAAEDALLSLLARTVRLLATASGP